MAEIYVAGSSSLQQVIDDLTRLNQDFRTKAADIDSEHSQLVTKWEGDASDAFENHYRAERSNFENFATAIDEYIAGLREILSSYENAESRNVQIGSE